MGRPKLTPDERGLVKALTAMELEIDRLARVLTSRGGNAGVCEAGMLRHNWARTMCDITTAQALENIIRSRPRTPGRLKLGGTEGGTEGRKKQKT